MWTWSMHVEYALRVPVSELCSIQLTDFLVLDRPLDESVTVNQRDLYTFVPLHARRIGLTKSSQRAIILKHHVHSSACIVWLYNASSSTMWRFLDNFFLLSAWAPWKKNGHGQSHSKQRSNKGPISSLITDANCSLILKRWVNVQ